MCASNATCANTEGDYNCTCNSGYYGDGFICNSKIIPLTLLLNYIILFQILMNVLKGFTCVMIMPSALTLMAVTTVCVTLVSLELVPTAQVICII